MSVACRACDGFGAVRKRDPRTREMIVSPKPCARCGGARVEPGPPKGDGRRFFRRAPRQEQDEDEMSLDRQADAFLRGRGFGRHGR